jgi:Rps23 Pro-64 3,4-dihydroxylase Tpa1-like proline 4-hydroxylase
MENQEREARDRYEFPASVRLLAQPGLASQFIVQLNMRLESAPATQLFRELVNVYRRIGDLEMAVKTAMEWMSFDPSDSQAEHMACLLNRQKPSGDCYPPDKLQPAPFAIIDDFLTQDERERFWRLALKSEEAFFEAGFARKGEQVIDRQSRMTNVFKLEAADKRLFHGKLQPLLDDLLVLFSIPAMSHKEIEVKMTAHSQGGFFGIHQDGFKDNGGSERYVSWIYYFHSQPKRYAGGDLILFDSNRLRENHRFDDGKYTRYITVDNQLVCFPSCFFHGVTPVELLQPDFECNRFAISGHVRF